MTKRDHIERILVELLTASDEANNSLTNAVITDKFTKEAMAVQQMAVAVSARTFVYALDPAYGGGDRCVGMLIEFGPGLDGKDTVCVELSRK
jgi:hypothetical protein